MPQPLDPSRRHVACWLTFETDAEASIALQVAVAPSAGVLVQERLVLTIDDRPVAPAAELVGELGGRIHVVEPGAGTLRLTYEATLDPATAPSSATSPAGGSPELARDPRAIAALHPSAYCRSDLLAGFAAAELGALREQPDLPQAVASWVFERLAYEPGASGPLDSAVHTLLTNAGVCRDFAHLAITLLRALGLPARLVAVYAPGLTPMDFHAVVEVFADGGWHVLDPTRLAPRPTLVRIATGRDAADTAFATTLRGSAELVASDVSAVTDGILPLDDHHAVTPLP